MSPVAHERLNRFLARRGVASRRGADELIASGRVSVNAVTATLGLVVDPARDAVTVDGRGVAGWRRPATTLLLNKPRGAVTTRHDPQHRLTVMDLVEPVAGLVPVGRLDADSHGLLLLTTDGELAHRITHPRFGVRKRYRATVDGWVSSEQLKRLLTGVRLEDGMGRAEEVLRGAGPGVLDVVMVEGRRREVRRLFAAIGLVVIDLYRLAVGPIPLGGLPEGKWRRITETEDSALRGAVGLVARR